MSEYTPTTADIRHGYIVTSMRYTPETDDHLLSKRRREVADEFDRWLAGVKADAWDEGEQAGMRRADWEYGATPNMPKPNPYEGDRHAGQ